MCWWWCFCVTLILTADQFVNYCFTHNTTTTFNVWSSQLLVAIWQGLLQHQQHPHIPLIVSLCWSTLSVATRLLPVLSVMCHCWSKYQQEHTRNKRRGRVLINSQTPHTPTFSSILFILLLPPSPPPHPLFKVLTLSNVSTLPLATG